MVRIAAKHSDERKHNEADNENDFSRGKVELCLQMETYNIVDKQCQRRADKKENRDSWDSEEWERALKTYLAVYFDRESVENEDDNETVRDPDRWGRVG